MKRIYAMIAATALIVVAAFIFSNRAEPTIDASPKVREPNILRLDADAPQLAYLQIAAIKNEIIPALEPLHGRVTYDDDVTARITAPIAGRITKIQVHLGDLVQAGQSLVEIDAPEFGQARADLHKAQSDLQLKTKAFARAKLLFDGEVIAEKDYEAAADDLAQTHAEFERAAQRLHNLGGDRDVNYHLRSPIAGVVTERKISTGSEVAADITAPLFVVTDPTRLWIDIEAAENDLNKLSLGQHFTLQTDAYPGETFETSVVFIGKTLDSQTRRVTVHCVLHDDSERLKPEMYVRATPLGGNVSRPRVPNTALINEGVKTYLFVEQKAGVLQKRAVTLAYRGHDDSYIEQGVQADERIVVGGALLLNAEMQGD
ncbi:MAG: rane-fusion protein [Verrucomicrobiaceae bacterium]|nr:rane-fusion protein [Verrucomicrobiaceae bacterium]